MNVVNGENGADPLDIEAARQTRAAMSGKIGVPVRRIFSQAESFRVGLRNYRRYLVCKNGPGKLNAEEFLRYGLGRQGVENIDRFVGNEIQKQMHAACNDKTWFAVTKNKLLWQSIMAGGGFDVPRVLAIYDKKGRGSGAPVLRNAHELADFLMQQNDIPIFCKPNTGVYSIGAIRIDAIEKGMVRINSHWVKSVAELAAYFEQIAKKGYILQTILRPHQGLEQLAPGSISTLRLMLFLNGSNSEVFRVALKIPGGGQVADNFWREGALLCSVDIHSGKITRAVMGGEKASFAQEVPQRGGIDLHGWSVPDFHAGVELAVRASRFFPGIQTQSWDIALSDKGPILLELNFGGDLGLLQMAHDKGALGPQYMAHLQRCGYRGRL